MSLKPNGFLKYCYTYLEIECQIPNSEGAGLLRQRLDAYCDDDGGRAQSESDGNTDAYDANVSDGIVGDYYILSSSLIRIGLNYNLNSQPSPSPVNERGKTTARRLPRSLLLNMQTDCQVALKVWTGWSLTMQTINWATTSNGKMRKTLRGRCTCHFQR